jgi:hypothetical protein
MQKFIGVRSRAALLWLPRAEKPVTWRVNTTTVVPHCVGPFPLLLGGRKWLDSPTFCGRLKCQEFPSLASRIGGIIFHQMTCPSMKLSQRHPTTGTYFRTFLSTSLSDSCSVYIHMRRAFVPLGGICVEHMTGVLWGSPAFSRRCHPKHIHSPTPSLL